MNKNITVEEILKATNGTLIYGNKLEECESFSKNTKEIKDGDVYIGFKGERFQEILAVHPDIEDKKDAVELKDVKGDITFENVSFQYEENTEKVLNHISLNVPAGAYMALVGSSGAGKSTLCSLTYDFFL